MKFTAHVRNNISNTVVYQTTSSSIPVLHQDLTGKYAGGTFEVTLGYETDTEIFYFSPSHTPYIMGGNYNFKIGYHRGKIVYKTALEALEAVKTMDDLRNLTLTISTPNDIELQFISGTDLVISALEEYFEYFEKPLEEEMCETNEPPKVVYNLLVDGAVVETTPSADVALQSITKFKGVGKSYVLRLNTQVGVNVMTLSGWREIKDFLFHVVTLPIPEIAEPEFTPFDGETDYKKYFIQRELHDIHENLKSTEQVELAARLATVIEALK